MSPQVFSRYVSQDPQVLGGTAVLTGTRIPIERIRQLIIQGQDPAQIAEGYPWVNKKKIYGAVAGLMKAGLDAFEAQKTQASAR